LSTANREEKEKGLFEDNEESNQTFRRTKTEILESCQVSLR
jgi:hypothetical protein